MIAPEVPAEAQPEVEAVPAVATEEPAFIEVWRPGRPPERPRHGKPRRHQRPDQAKTEAATAGATPAPAEAVTAEGAAPLQPRPQHKPRPPHHRKEAKGGQPRHQRPERQEGGRPPRRDKDRNQDRGAFTSQRPPERREKVADPNSPFAKLAALKAQLEADSKERR
jgi:ATP-dependent RNA helicase SUPV3L1/SUV3